MFISLKIRLFLICSLLSWSILPNFLLGMSWSVLAQTSGIVAQDDSFDATTNIFQWYVTENDVYGWVPSFQVLGQPSTWAVYMNQDWWFTLEAPVWYSGDIVFEYEACADSYGAPTLNINNTQASIFRYWSNVWDWHFSFSYQINNIPLNPVATFSIPDTIDCVSRIDRWGGYRDIQYSTDDRATRQTWSNGVCIDVTDIRSIESPQSLTQRVGLAIYTQQNNDIENNHCIDMTLSADDVQYEETTTCLRTWPIYDLSLTKTILPKPDNQNDLSQILASLFGGPGGSWPQIQSYRCDEQLDFMIQVTNEWTMPASSFEIIDSFPDYLELIPDNSRTVDGTNAAYNHSQLLEPWESISLPISFVNKDDSWSQTRLGRNYAQISRDDGEDIDSIPGSAIDDPSMILEDDFDNDWFYTSSCTTALCSDGTALKIVWSACDDGNPTTVDDVMMDACNCGWTLTTTSTTICGNGVVEGTEQCDDGNTINTDACTNICTKSTISDSHSWWSGGSWRIVRKVKYCGDGVLNGDEQCDDGNYTRGDWCSPSCMLEQDEAQNMPEDVVGISTGTMTTLTTTSHTIVQNMPQIDEMMIDQIKPKPKIEAKIEQMKRNLMSQTTSLDYFHGSAIDAPSFLPETGIDVWSIVHAQAATTTTTTTTSIVARPTVCDTASVTVSFSPIQSSCEWSISLNPNSPWADNQSLPGLSTTVLAMYDVAASEIMTLSSLTLKSPDWDQSVYDAINMIAIYTIDGIRVSDPMPFDAETIVPFVTSVAIPWDAKTTLVLLWQIQDSDISSNQEISLDLIGYNNCDTEVSSWVFTVANYNAPTLVVDNNGSIEDTTPGTNRLVSDFAISNSSTLGVFVTHIAITDLQSNMSNTLTNFNVTSNWNNIQATKQLFRDILLINLGTPIFIASWTTQNFNLFADIAYNSGDAIELVVLSPFDVSWFDDTSWFWVHIDTSWFLPQLFNINSWAWELEIGVSPNNHNVLEANSVMCGEESDFIAAFDLDAINESIRVEDMTLTIGWPNAADAWSTIKSLTVYGSDLTTVIYGPVSVDSPTVDLNNINFVVPDNGGDTLYVKIEAERIGQNLPGKQSGPYTLSMDIGSNDAVGMVSGQYMSPVSTWPSEEFSIVPVGLSSVDFVSSVGNTSVDSTLSTDTNVALLKVVADNRNCTDSTWWDLDLQITSISLNETLGTSWPTTVTEYTIQRTTNQVDLNPEYSTNSAGWGWALITFDTSASTDDFVLNAGETAYYVVEAKGVSLNGPNSGDDSVRLQINDLSAGAITYEADDSAISGRAPITDPMLWYTVVSNPAVVE